jgi:hypothetical protein
MEAAFNADLARQLAANCGAAVDKASRKYKEVTLKVHWDPAAMKAVVSACYGHDSDSLAETFGIGTSADDVEGLVSALATRTIRRWRRANAEPAYVRSDEDDDIPF